MINNKNKGITKGLMVGIDISKGEDLAVLIVGDPNKKPTEIINAVSGKEAIDLYYKLIGDDINDAQ